MLFSLSLSFTEPTAAILNAPDLYVDKGSTINLTCTIRFGHEPPGFIFWYHEDKVCVTNHSELHVCRTYIVCRIGRESMLAVCARELELFWSVFRVWNTNDMMRFSGWIYMWAVWDLYARELRTRRSMLMNNCNCVCFFVQTLRLLMRFWPIAIRWIGRFLSATDARQA